MGSYDITIMAGLWVTFRDAFRKTILFKPLFNVCHFSSTNFTGFRPLLMRTKYKQMISVMRETIDMVHIIDSAVARWDRRREEDVRDAYRSIMQLEERETGAPVDPRGHVCWLDGFARGGGFHILQKERLDSLLRTIETTGVYHDDTDVNLPCAAKFDPSTQFVVLSQPSVVSYLAQPMVGRVEEFGSNAMGVSPCFKYSVLWWNV